LFFSFSIKSGGEHNKRKQGCHIKCQSNAFFSTLVDVVSFLLLLLLLMMMMVSEER
jgi:hypothetical protein